MEVLMPYMPVMVHCSGKVHNCEPLVTFWVALVISE